jgi:hypothetical protein
LSPKTALTPTISSPGATPAAAARGAQDWTTTAPRTSWTVRPNGRASSTSTTSAPSPEARGRPPAERGRSGASGRSGAKLDATASTSNEPQIEACRILRRATYRRRTHAS